jgi:hypothetical protein
MNAAFDVLPRGTLYIDSGEIVAVLPRDAPAPEGFESTPLIETGGTLYPGLIELHNHLSYNVLPLWNVPRAHTNRDQWGGTTTYRKLISGPMTVLGKTPGFVEAVVRYVECKSLLGGVTTTQGIALFSNSGISQYYKGIVRNAEQPDDPLLPSARSRIADVVATDATKFLKQLQTSSCLLLHLSEGIDQKAREHFLALQLPDQSWAITPALAGIHCVALTPGDLEALQKNGGAMVWSPLSNLLLYGQTADIQAAKASGVLMGIGPDWSPSGSKNILGELKVAHLVSAAQGGVFSDRELVAMATRNAAAILKWDHRLGSIEAGKRADLIVAKGQSGDPYAQLLHATEEDLVLVMVNGAPRCGTPTLMQNFGSGTETWTVGSSARVLNLAQKEADPVVGALTLRQARDRLKDGMARLGELAQELENPSPGVLEPEEPQWFLLLDQEETPDNVIRPHLPFGPEGTLTAEMPESGTLGIPLSGILEPVELDALTAADDAAFIDKLRQELNLPDAVKDGLRSLF